MRGIYLENLKLYKIYLYQRTVEYQLNPDNRNANVLRLIKDIKISSDRRTMSLSLENHKVSTTSPAGGWS